MGAVAAILGSDRPDRMHRMLAAAPHRGDEFASQRTGGITLGMSNRVDLIDATLAVDGDWGAVVQGLLDNRSQLVSALSSDGFSLEPDVSAARCVIEAHRCWGDAMWHRLRGEFAILLTDGIHVWAARDQLGGATLFFRRQGSTVFIASEAKQVVRGAGVEREPDIDSLEELFFGSQDEYAEPPCALVGVERVPRATVVRFDMSGRTQRRRYWDPSDKAGTLRLSQTEVRDHLAHYLSQAVERTMSGNDVIALSGGIDSPAIAAFAAPVAHRHGSKLKALSTVYPHAPTVDETRYVEPIVDQLDLDWHSFVPQYDPFDDFQHWIDRFDGPVPSIDTSAVAEFLGKARDLGVSTVLFGELAELVIDLRQHLEGHLLLHGRWPTAARLLAAKHTKGISWVGVFRSILPSITPPRPAIWFVRRRGKQRNLLTPWIDPAFVPGLDARWDLARPARSRWLDIQTYFTRSPSNIGVEATSISAASFGLHLRRPFVDVDLWEFLLGLPAHRKDPGPVSKSIIRDVLRGRIPDMVLDRTDKTGFNEDVLSRANLSELRRWIFDTDFRMRGIRYDVIEDLLERGTPSLWDQRDLRYLAAVHAFVDVFQ